MSRTRRVPPARRLLRVLGTLLPAVALVLGVGAVAPTAAVGTGAPGAVSRGWNNFSCKPSPAHPRPVVLIHGSFANSVDDFVFLAPYLVNRGYCVFSLDHGQLPGVPFFHGLAPVKQSSAQLSAYVDRVREATGAPKVDLVGHSQGGGVVPRYYLNFLDGAGKVNSLTGLVPSNHGTTVSGMTKLVDAIPGARRAVHGLTPGVADQLVGSAFIKELNSRPDTVPGVSYTVVATKYDEIVTPYQSQYLSGPNVRNILLQDRCPADLSEHFATGLIDRVAFKEVTNTLDPAHARPATCADMVS